MAETTDFTLRSQWQAEKVTCHACRVKDAHTDGRAAGEFVVVTRRDDDG